MAKKKKQEPESQPALMVMEAQAEDGERLVFIGIDDAEVHEVEGKLVPFVLMGPDMARLAGVKLIEAAAYAEEEDCDEDDD